MTCAHALCAMLDISGTTVTLRPTEHPQAQEGGSGVLYLLPYLGG